MKRVPPSLSDDRHCPQVLVEADHISSGKNIDLDKLLAFIVEQARPPRPAPPLPRLHLCVCVCVCVCV